MEINIPERLHNCPNCGGTLQDDGACRFCGSRVYDFVSVDMENYKPTYLRILLGGNIVLMPVRFDSLSIKSSMDQPIPYADDCTYTLMESVVPTGKLEFTVVGDTIIEDTKITGG